MYTLTDPEKINALNSELAALDQTKIQIDGIELLPSQCYHIGNNPSHILFNTNCPDELKARIETILSSYIDSGEGRS